MEIALSAICQLTILLIYSTMGWVQRMALNKWFFMNYNTLALYSIYYIALFLTYIILVSLAGCTRAWITNLMGDSTAKDEGYLTLNPGMHFDLLGSIMFLTLGIGWGSQIPINPYNIGGHFKKLKIIIAMMSGFLAYLLLALIGIIGLSALLSPAGLTAVSPWHLVFINTFIERSILLAAIQLVINSVLLALMAMTHYNDEIIRYSFYIILIIPIAIFWLYGYEIQGYLSEATFWLAKLIVTLFNGKQL